MLRTTFIKIVQQKNPHFQLNEKIGMRVIAGFAFQKLISQLRGLRRIFSGNYSPTQFFGKNVTLFNASNIRLGKWVQIEDHCYLSGFGNGGIDLGNNVRIGAFSRLVVGTSFDNLGEYIKIGNNVGLGEFAYLGGGGGLEIGDDCIIGQYLSCHPENHNFNNPNELIRLQGTTRKGIKIGKNCWIGAKVTILDGVEIGDNCVIAAGAVVTSSMPSHTVIGGVPARILKCIKHERPIEIKAQFSEN